MNYIGSKFKLREFLYTHIYRVLQEDDYKSLNECIFCDMFAGTGVVGRYFKNKVKQVLANDKEYYNLMFSAKHLCRTLEIFKQ
ncbi:DNA adenine methylase [Helicobacter sp. 13S00482-2]|uniref:DNA adenine methylase n=1 Tax=Helicobacter sp. 13S00482-2 TaxID=1476200 RepID=UPI000BA5D427|nr:DNA adenine methylase [Helicobacter sp. 13S00482-2]